MKSTTKPGFAKAALAAAALSALLPFGAQAASQLQTAATGGASANLNFNVVIPRVLFLQVGTGPASTMSPLVLATNGAVNTISFDVPAASLGNGSPVTATGTSGDQGGGAVTARVISNSGTVTLTITAPPNLTNATSDTLPLTEISVSLGGIRGPRHRSPTPLRG